MTEWHIDAHDEVTRDATVYATIRDHAVEDVARLLSKQGRKGIDRTEYEAMVARRMAQLAKAQD